jgi:spore germination protein KB
MYNTKKQVISMEKLSNYQLIALTVMTQLGTTVLFAFNASAGRDAWISILISLAIGLLLIVIYTTLAYLHPGLTLVQWYPIELGSLVGTSISWIYILSILYDASRLIADLKNILPMTILPNTPPFASISLFLIVVTYAIFGGIETLGRLGEILFPPGIIVFFIEVLLIFRSDIININNLLPMIGEGWTRILTPVFPLGISQTFAETIRFAMIWPLVNKPNHIMKSTLISTIISGFIIISLNLLAILCLGEHIYTNSFFPLLKLSKLISMGDFIENLQIISLLFFLTTSFFKLCIEIFAITRGIQQLTYTKNNRFFIIPIVITVFFVGMTMSSNISEHVEAGLKVLPYNLWMPLYIILPCLLLVIVLIRKYLLNRGGI